MPTPGQKTKKKKKRRTAKGCKDYYVREKTGKHHCAICGHELHGVPHGKINVMVSKLSKTEKRPSVPFGGILCTKCRRLVIEQETMVKNGFKKIDGVDFKARKFFASASDRIAQGASK